MDGLGAENRLCIIRGEADLIGFPVHDFVCLGFPLEDLVEGEFFDLGGLDAGLHGIDDPFWAISRGC